MLFDVSGIYRPSLKDWFRPVLIGIAFWTAVGLFFSSGTHLMLVARGGDARWSSALLNSMPTWYLWGLLTPFIIWTDRRFAAPRRSIYRRIGIHAPASVFWTIFYLLLGQLLQEILNGRPIHIVFRGLFAGTFHWNNLIYWLIVGGYLAREYYRESQERALRAAQLEKLLVEARLQTLRAQLNPHFLFNALNAISAFVERDPQRTRSMIEHLGSFLRLSLYLMDRQQTTLEQELRFLEHYTAIQRVRFEDRLQVVMKVDPETLGAKVPTLLLQPFVENAITHGTCSSAATAVVEVVAQRRDGSLELAVRDNGPGLPAGWDWLRSEGRGLANTRERLEHLYPAHHTFTVKNNSDKGVAVEVSIPYCEGGNGDK